MSLHLGPAISVALHLTSIGVLIVSAVIYILFLSVQEQSCVHDQSLVYREINVDFEFGMSLYLSMLPQYGCCMLIVLYNILIV